MPEVIKVKTGNKFEEHGSYSRLVAVDDMIFVSNTAGRSPRDTTRAPALFRSGVRCPV